MKSFARNVAQQTKYKGLVKKLDKVAALKFNKIKELSKIYETKHPEKIPQMR